MLQLSRFADVDDDAAGVWRGGERRDGFEAVACWFDGGGSCGGGGCGGCGAVGVSVGLSVGVGVGEEGGTGCWLGDEVVVVIVVVRFEWL